MDWTPTEIDVWNDVSECLALTTRRITADHGPRPNWKRLLDNHWLEEVQTTYGPVLALTKQAYDHLPSQSRLTGPNSLADRAYMMDAVRMLEGQGYEWLDWDYKLYQDTKRCTAHITRARMRAPQTEMRRLIAYFGDPGPPRLAPSGVPEERLGEIWLYARCSGGGVQATELRKLLKLHGSHITYSWRSPLLIVTPEESGALRHLVRRTNARAAQNHGKSSSYDSMVKAPLHLVVQCFERPLPQSRVRRPSQGFGESRDDR
ncbi:hypothetical protein [Deinococcus sp. RM]|uniref:hypothetical protein n=1 Tax=Deinococcus sp. RM TaxID=2316359 RepID=UPI0011C23F56|nr:hypothetical protein [Deinococcus sp. RM]